MDVGRDVASAVVFQAERGCEVASGESVGHLIGVEIANRKVVIGRQAIFDARDVGRPQRVTIASEETAELQEAADHRELVLDRRTIVLRLDAEIGAQRAEIRLFTNVKIDTGADGRQGLIVVTLRIRDRASGDVILETKITAGLQASLGARDIVCLLYTSPSPRDRQKSRMPSSA